MPLISHGLTHVAIRVRDLDRACAFYQALLGSEIAFRDDTKIELSTPGHLDALTLQLSDDAATIGVLAGVIHFGFRLANLTAPDDIAAAVIAAGGIVESKGEFAPGVPYAYARDPDGYLIELFYEP